MDSVKKLKDIIEYLKTKKTLLYEMKDLTTQQTDSITKEDVETLSTLIGKKDDLIKRIMEIDNSFKSAYDSLKAELGVVSLDKSDALPKTLLVELKEQTKEILDLIGDITKIDDDNKKNAQIFKESLANKIRKINNTKQAYHAYFGKSTIFQGSYFIDSKK